MSMTSQHRGVQRRTGVTVWKQIADTLTQEVRDRVYASTGCLPSEQALAARFDVNRHTLRQAIASLEQAGLVRVEQGRGAFIQHDWVDYTVARRTRYSENIVRNQLLPASRLLSGREEAATAPVAQALGLRKGARVLVAELLQEASGQPIGLSTMVFAAARFAGLLEMLAEGRSVTSILQHFGIADYFRARNRITTQMPSEEVARLLQLPRTRPLLHVESVDVDAGGTPIKYGESLFSGDRVQIVFDPER
jgi:GntR family phosphonate transport system transcriptional regulator